MREDPCRIYSSTKTIIPLEFKNALHSFICPFSACTLSQTCVRRHIYLFLYSLAPPQTKCRELLGSKGFTLQKGHHPQRLNRSHRKVHCKVKEPTLSSVQVVSTVRCSLKEQPAPRGAHSGWHSGVHFPGTNSHRQVHVVVKFKCLQAYKVQRVSTVWGSPVSSDTKVQIRSRIVECL